MIKPTTVPLSNDATLDSDKNERAIQLVIGSHTTIGENSRISSLSVGSNVRIGKNCVLAPRSRVYDCCVVEDDTIIPQDMIVPPFSRVAGSPGRVVGMLPECCGGEFVEECVADYTVFVKRLEGR